MSFDWSLEMWKLEESSLEEDKNLVKDLRARLGRVGIHLRPFPGERQHLSRQPNALLNARDFDQVVESIVIDKAKYVAICMKGKAFHIVSPTPMSSIWASPIVSREEDESTMIDSIIRNDLSGVTDRIDYKFQFPHIIGKVHAEIYQTYDVWLVAELLELLAEKVSKVQAVVSKNVQDALDDRFNQRQRNRRPIPEVEQIRNPDVPLHPHQCEAVRFFMENKGRGLLGDEMGL